jgi:hypothetical protein
MSTHSTFHSCYCRPQELLPGELGICQEPQDFNLWGVPESVDKPSVRCILGEEEFIYVSSAVPDKISAYLLYQACPMS